MRSYVVDNASSDHTREVLRTRSDLPLHVTHSEENLGGAGGFHLGVEQAFLAGHDRIWLMDDDVVPAADCLAVLLARDESCLMAVREDLAGKLVEKAAVHFDLRRPLAIRPEAVERGDGVRHPRADARAGGDRERRVRGVHGAPPGDRDDRAAGPGVLHLLRRRRLRHPRPPGGVPHLGGPGRRARAPAGLRPAARPRHLEGVLHVPQPLPGPLPARRERPGPAPSPTRSRRRWSR